MHAYGLRSVCAREWSWAGNSPTCFLLESEACLPPRSSSSCPLLLLLLHPHYARTKRCTIHCPSLHSVLASCLPSPSPYPPGKPPPPSSPRHPPHHTPPHPSPNTTQTHTANPNKQHTNNHNKHGGTTRRRERWRRRLCLPTSGPRTYTWRGCQHHDHHHPGSAHLLRAPREPDAWPWRWWRRRRDRRRRGGRRRDRKEADPPLHGQRSRWGGRRRRRGR